MHISGGLRALPVLQEFMEESGRRSRRCSSNNLLANVHSVTILLLKAGNTKLNVGQLLMLATDITKFVAH